MSFPHRHFPTNNPRTDTFPIIAIKITIHLLQYLSHNYIFICISWGVLVGFVGSSNPQESLPSLCNLTIGTNVIACVMGVMSVGEITQNWK